MADPQAQPLRGWIRGAVRYETLPSPEFKQTIGWAPTYEALFEHEFEAQLSVDSLLDQALTHGRVLLSGKGGSGKTVALKRLCVRSADRGRGLPLLVSLVTWNAGHEKIWE